MLIFPITNKQGYNNFRRSLLNIAEEIRLSSNLLCITNKEDIYLKCRNFLPTIFDSNVACASGKYLTVFSDKNKLLNEAKKHINNVDKYVFLYNENVVIRTGTIKRLLSDYLEKPKAGFITGHFVEYPISYKLDNIYSKEPEKIYSNEMILSSNHLNEIDTTFPYGMMTSMNNFLYYNWNDDALNYGIFLRKQGYTNYLDINIKYKYGDNKYA